MRFLPAFLILMIALASAGAWAAPAADEVPIFKGDDPSLEDITLGGWGGGSAVKSKERILDRSYSIKITSQGLYSGGRLDFENPPTLFSGPVDDSRYILFTFFFKDTQVINPAAGSEYWYDADPYTMPKANVVRFVFVSDSGTAVSAQQPTTAVDPDDNWVRIAVPLSKFKETGFTGEFRLKRLLIFSDISGTMYLGSARVITDSDPIKVEPLDSKTVAIMDEVLLVANAKGGYSSLRYSWDFDNSNGIQSESTGVVARYVYTRGGEFTVTLTVSDADNLKAPVTVTTDISVND